MKMNFFESVKMALKSMSKKMRSILTMLGIIDDLDLVTSINNLALLYHEQKNMLKRCLFI